MKTKRWKKVVAIMLSVMLLMQSNLSVIAEEVLENMQENTENVEQTVETTTKATTKAEEIATEAITTADEAVTTEAATTEAATEATTEAATEATTEVATEATTAAEVTTTTEAAKETTTAPKKTVIGRVVSKTAKVLNEGETTTPTTYYMAGQEGVNANMLSSVVIKVKPNDSVDKWYYLTSPIPDTDKTGEMLPPTMKVPKNAEVDVKIAYQPGSVQFKIGDKVIYQIPNSIVVDTEQKGEVKDGRIVVGSYKIDINGLITITLTNEDYLQDSKGHLIDGTVTFNGHFNEDFWQSGGDQTIIFGKQTITVPLEPDQVAKIANLEILKSVINGNEIKYESTEGYYYIDYQIRVNAVDGNNVDITNVKVADTFTAGGDYIDSLTMIESSTGSFNSSTHVWTIGKIEPKDSATATFRAKIKANVYDTLNNSGKLANGTITNKATVTSDNASKKESSVSTALNSSLVIRKSTTGYDRATKTVSYTVTVEAGKNNSWPITGVNVKDVFGDNKKYVTEYSNIKVKDASEQEGAASETATAPYKVVETNDTSKQLDWTVGTVKPGETYTLTYTVSIDDDIFYDGSSATVTRYLKNAADLYTGKTKKGNSNASVKFHKVWIWKSGGKVLSDGRFKFSIHANEATGDGYIMSDDMVFTDTLTGPWSYDGNLVVKMYQSGNPAEGYRYIGKRTININGLKTWTWSTDEQTSGYYYEFEYYAKVDEGVIGTPSIKNTAGVGIGPSGNSFYHKTEWKGTGKTYDALNKFHDSLDTENGTAKWTSKIICPVISGAEYEDYRDVNAGRAWYFTQAQYDAIQVYKLNEEKQPVPLALNSYEIEKVGESGDKISGFKVRFKNNISASENDPIFISYENTLDTAIDEGASATYVNKAKLTVGSGNTDYSQAQCSYTKEWQMDKLAGTYDKNKDLMTWKIKLNITGTMNGKATIVDYIPEGLVFVEPSDGQLPFTKGTKASANTTVTLVDAGTDAEDTNHPNCQKIKFEVDNLIESNDALAYVEVTITTKVVDETFFVSNGNKTFTNNAYVKYDGGTKGSSASQKIENITLTKEGTYNSLTAPNAEYKVVVNPDAHDMLQNEAYIKITDTMAEGMMLNVDSLKVVGEKSNEIPVLSEPAYDFTNNANVFSFKVPDDEKVTITYKVYVSGEIGTTKDIVNTVKYEGVDSTTPVENKKTIKVAESSATIAQLPAFYIKKTDGLTNAPLEGVKYELYEVIDNQGNVATTPLKSVESLEDGYIDFLELDETKVYAFKETETLQGYYIDPLNRDYTYVAFKNSELVDKLSKNGIAVTVIQKGTEFYRSNKKAEIILRKVFANISPVPDGEYYFGLFDGDGSNAKLLYDGEDKQVKSITVRDGEIVNENDSIIFRNVDIDSDGSTKVYYVFETDENGNKLNENNDGTLVVNNTRFVVENDGRVLVSGFVLDEKGNYKLNDEGERIYKSEQTISAPITITNTYAPLEVTLKATKYIENGDKADAKTFEFQLIDGAKGTVIDTKSNDANGNIVFDKLTYVSADIGTHNYIVKEVIPNSIPNNGIKYDTHEYDVQITVNSDLTVSVKVDDDLRTASNGVYTIPKKNGKGSFVNEYDVSTSIKFDGKKYLKDANYDLGADKYSFEITGPNLKDEDGKAVETLTIGHKADGVDRKSGTIEYPRIYYSLADLAGATNKDANGDTYKDFTYTISEVVPAENPSDGITYPTESLKVVVRVTNTGTALTAEAIEGSNNDNKASGLDFTNTYYAEETTTVEGTKALTGAELRADAFTFEITEVDSAGNAIVDGHNEKVKNTVNADGVGEFKFTLPKYTQEDAGDTFRYEVSEVNEGKLGFTYSTDKFTVAVTVTDNGNGTLTLTKTIDGSTTKAIEFTNEFKGSVTLTKHNGKEGDAYKVLEGAVFELYNANNQLIKDEEYTTNENGVITVDGLTEGSYYFKEKTPPAGYSITNNQTIPFEIRPGERSNVYPSINVGNEQKLGTLKLQKKDADGQPLAGATFVLYKEGENAPVWGPTMTDGNGQLSVSNLSWGTYWFEETVPAPGYYLPANTTTEKVTINAQYVDGNVVTLDMVNDSTKYKFAKVDAKTEELVKGARLQIIDKETEVIVVEPWVSSEEIYKEVNAILVEGKTYVLQEIVTPDGYEFGNSVTFTVNNRTEDLNIPITITMEDKQTELKISKLDATGKEAVEGATFEIYEKAVYGTEDAKPVDTWTTTDGDYIITGLLNVNTPYIMVETDAPVGYGYVEPIEFQITSAVDNDGKATTKVEILDSKAGEAEVDGIDGIDGIDVFDRAVELYLNKVEAFAETEEPSEGEEAKKPEIVFVKGAELTIFDAEGKEVVAWTSDGENAFNFGPYLKADKTYTLKETAAPDGYAYIADINFKVNKDGSIEIIDKKLEVVTDEEGAVTYLVEDHFTKAVIKKVDSEGKQLKGAELVIKDAETGKEVMKFTSGEEAEEITGKLVAGKKYYLVEEKAPDGYLIAADVEFTVPEGEELVEVVMVDPKDEGEEKLGKISVQKNIALRTLEADFDLYTEDATYYVGLFTDPEGKHPYRADAIQPIRIIKGSTSDIVTYDKLPTGTYYILETTKDGKPIPMGEAQNDGKNVFTCEVVGEGQDNKLEIDVEQKAIEGKITLLNAYVELPDGYAYEGKINVTKNVLKNGVAYATDEVFYAGVFASETAETPVTVLTLENNGTATAVVPLGGTNGDQPITYYVYETDANGKKIDKEAFAYLVSGEGTVALSKEAPEGALTITNNLLTEVEVNILKVDTENVALAGAGFQVLAADGTVVAEWTSTEEAKSVILAPGTYTLTETEAPEGYVAGEDITITIAKDGTITIEGDGATLADNTISYENEEEVEETEETEEETSESSKTGDRTNMEIYMLLMAAAVITALAVARRKREEDL